MAVTDGYPYFQVQLILYRAVTRIFLSAGANSTNPHRDLPYTDRVSSQTLCQKKKNKFSWRWQLPPLAPYVRPCYRKKASAESINEAHSIGHW